MLSLALKREDYGGTSTKVVPSLDSLMTSVSLGEGTRRGRRQAPVVLRQLVGDESRSGGPKLTFSSQFPVRLPKCESNKQRQRRSVIGPEVGCIKVYADYLPRDDGANDQRQS